MKSNVLPPTLAASDKFSTWFMYIPCNGNAFTSWSSNSPSTAASHGHVHIVTQTFIKIWQKLKWDVIPITCWRKNVRFRNMKVVYTARIATEVCAHKGAPWKRTQSLTAGVFVTVASVHLAMGRGPAIILSLISLVSPSHQILLHLAILLLVVIFALYCFVFRDLLVVHGIGVFYTTQTRISLVHGHSDVIAVPFAPNCAKVLTLLDFVKMWGICSNVV